jgi:hypothetical protein
MRWPAPTVEGRAGCRSSRVVLVQGGGLQIWTAGIVASCHNRGAAAITRSTENVRGVTVEVVSVAVVAAGRARIGVAHRVLHFLERDAFGAGAGGECRSECGDSWSAAGMSAAAASRRSPLNTFGSASRPAPSAPVVANSGPVSASTVA